MRALAEVARAGRPVRLLMVGGKIGASDPTNQAYLAHVEQLIDDLGIADWVQWPASLPTIRSRPTCWPPIAPSCQTERARHCGMAA